MLYKSKRKGDILIHLGVIHLSANTLFTSEGLGSRVSNLTSAHISIVITAKRQSTSKGWE